MSTVDRVGDGADAAASDGGGEDGPNLTVKFCGSGTRNGIACVRCVIGILHRTKFGPDTADLTVGRVLRYVFVKVKFADRYVCVAGS